MERTRITANKGLIPAPVYGNSERQTPFAGGVVLRSYDDATAACRLVKGGREEVSPTAPVLPLTDNGSTPACTASREQEALLKAGISIMFHH